MPALGGRDLLERVRAERPALAARLVFVSGDSASEETRAFLRAAGRPLLRKPFAIARLETLLDAIARGDAAAAGAAADAI